MLTWPSEENFYLLGDLSGLRSRRLAPRGSSTRRYRNTPGRLLPRSWGQLPLPPKAERRARKLSLGNAGRVSPLETRRGYFVTDREGTIHGWEDGLTGLSKK